MVGLAVRSTLSTQPVHSCSCSQMTVGRFTASRALATRGPAALPRPRTIAISPQYFTKSRRETPRDSRCCLRVSLSVQPNADGLIIGTSGLRESPYDGIPDADIRKNWNGGAGYPDIANRLEPGVECFISRCGEAAPRVTGQLCVYHRATCAGPRRRGPARLRGLC